MRSPKFTLFPLCFFWTLGCLLSFYFKLPLPYCLGVSVLLFLLLCFLPKSSSLVLRWGKFILYSLLILCLAYTHAVQKQRLSANHFLRQYTAETDVDLHLVLTERLGVKNNSRFYAEVKSIAGRKASGKLLLTLYFQTQPPVEIGDHLKINTPIHPLDTPKNPGEFNYKTYLESHKIYARINVYSADEIELIPHNQTSLLKAKATALKIIEKSNFSSESKAIILAMLLGDRSTLSREKRDQFGDAGILHILAISGLHIGLLLLVLQFIFLPLKGLGKHSIIYHTFILGGLWMYAVLVGASPSVVRAVAMFSVFSVGALSRRKLPSYYWLLLSYFGLLLWNPLFLKQLGFQLSYTAVAGILLGYPKLKQLWHPSTFLTKKFWELTCVSLAAQLAVIPIALFYFGQFSALFLVSNWIVLPLLSFFYVLIVAAVLLLLIWGTLPKILVLCVDIGSKSLFDYAAWASKQTPFIWSDIVLKTPLLIGAYVFLLFFTLYVYKKRIQFLFYAIVIVFMGVSYSLYNNNRAIKGENLWVLQQYKQSSLAYRKGKKLTFYSTAKKEELAYLLSGIKKIFPIKSEDYFPLKNSYRYNDFSIIIVTSPEALQQAWPKEKEILLLLSHHPKIHLGALLERPNIKMVIADGSSPNYIKRKWEKTCEAYGIRFYDTAVEGALELSRENAE